MKKWIKIYLGYMMAVLLSCYINILIILLLLWNNEGVMVKENNIIILSLETILVFSILLAIPILIWVIIKHETL